MTSNPPTTTELTHKMVLRAMVNSAYDCQNIRIPTGGRLASIFFNKLGIQPSQKVYTEEAKTKKEKEIEKVIKLVKKDFNRITDAIALYNKDMKERSRLKTAMNATTASIDNILSKESSLITNKIEWDLTLAYMKMLDNEEQMFKDVGAYLTNFEIYNKYLVKVPGIGPAMGGMLVAYIDIHECTTVAKLWAYMGIDVVYDKNENKWIGRTNHGVSLVDREYLDKNGKIKTKKSISYNKALKTKMSGVLPGILIKCNKHYNKIYHDYKHRIENQTERFTPDKMVVSKIKGVVQKDDDGNPIMRPEFPPIRILKMSHRYMVKMFAKNLWVSWRYLEGLDLNLPYEEKVLGKDTSNHIDPWGLCPLPQKKQ